MRLEPSFLSSFGFITSPFDQTLTRIAVAPSVTIPNPVEIKAVNFAFGPDDGENQQVRALISYSESRKTSVDVDPNLAALNAEVIAGTFNPFNPSSASAATIAHISSFATFGQTDQIQLNARLIADGDLFALPGGPLKLAVWAEFISEGYDEQKGDDLPDNFSSLPRFEQSLDVTSIFGELVAPIFETDGLDFAASYRGDSSFGGLDFSIGGNLVRAWRGFVNGNTIGRLVQVGARAKF